MDIALGLPIALVVLVVLWNLRRGFFDQSEVWKEKVNINAKESQADLQEDYKALNDKVVDIKAKQDGKWFKMSDIEELMK